MMGRRNAGKPGAQDPKKALKRIASMIFSRYKYHCLLVVICLIVSAVANVRGTLFTQRLIDDYIIPMTGQEVRSAILAKLGIRPDDVCWDIGTGTGAVAVELALHSAAVWSADRNPAAIRLAERNRRRFGAWNLRLAEGAAPEVLTQFPTPDAVFIGGSGGNMQEILTAVHRKNPQARICVSAIAVETFHTAVQNLRKLGWTVEVCQIAVSRSRSVGDLTMMLARNPVWLITGNMN